MARFKFTVHGAYLKNLLKQYQRFGLVAAITMFVAFPLSLFLSTFLANTSNTASLSSFFSLNLICLFFTTVILTMMLFNFVNSKAKLDVYLALPITRRTLYLTHLCAALLISFVPFLLTSLLGYIAALLTQTIAAIPSVHLFFFLTLLLSLVFMIALAIITSIICLNTGTIINAVICLAIYLVIPIFILFTINLYMSLILQASTTWAGDILSYLSPLFGFFAPLSHLNAMPSAPQLVSWLVPALYWFILSPVLAVIGVYFMRRRQQDDAEKPYINSFFIPALITICTMLILTCLLLLFRSMTFSNIYSRALSVPSLLIPVALVFVLYLIVNTILNHDIKHLPHVLVQYVTIAAVTTSVVAGSFVTSGFGYFDYKPKAEQLTKIQLIINEPNGLVSDATLLEYEPYTNLTAYTSTSDIAAVLTFYNRLIDSRGNDFNNDDNFAFDSQNISVTFNFYESASTIVTRTLNIPENALVSSLPLASTTPFLNNRYPLINTSLNLNYYNLNTVFGQTINLQLIANFNVSLFRNYVREDILRLNTLLFYEVSHPILYQLNYAVTQSENKYGVSSVLNIDERFTSTVNYLNSLNLSFDSLVLPSTISARALVHTNSSMNGPAFYTSFGTLRYPDSGIFDPSYNQVNTVQTYSLTASELQALSAYFVANGIDSQPHDVIMFTLSNPAAYILNAEGEQLLQTIIAGKTSFEDISSNDLFSSGNN